MSQSLLLLPGDGIGQEIAISAERAIDTLNTRFQTNIQTSSAAFGGTAYDETGSPLPDDTLERALQA
ncbi:MAG: 3-isopropylmalate dehydrogenase, partial [Actinomycetia bacterium]|nr:3-isopropylmalate dehydrogenase [Actinomycetes bacterium]